MKNSPANEEETERFADVVHMAAGLGLTAADLDALAADVPLSIISQAVAEAARAGDKLYAPAAFVKRRARLLAESQARQQDYSTRRSKAIDRVARARIAESADAKVARDQAFQSVQQKLATIPQEELERLKTIALAEMGDVVRLVAVKRGFEASSVWQIRVVELWGRGSADT